MTTIDRDTGEGKMEPQGGGAVTVPYRPCMRLEDHPYPVATNEGEHWNSSSFAPILSSVPTYSKSTSSSSTEIKYTVDQLDILLFCWCVQSTDNRHGSRIRLTLCPRRWLVHLITARITQHTRDHTYTFRFYFHTWTWKHRRKTHLHTFIETGRCTHVNSGRHMHTFWKTQGPEQIYTRIHTHLHECKFTHTHVNIHRHKSVKNDACKLTNRSKNCWMNTRPWLKKKVGLLCKT